MPKKIINWSQLSIALGLDRSAISEGRCPNRYMPLADDLKPLFADFEKAVHKLESELSKKIAKVLKKHEGLKK